MLLGRQTGGHRLIWLVRRQGEEMHLFKNILSRIYCTLIILILVINEITLI